MNDDRRYRMCVRCGAGENPRSNNQFIDGPEGPTCARCADRLSKSAPGASPTSLAERVADAQNEVLVVIRCPGCGGGQQAPHCQHCAGFGAVRVPMNALPVYRPKTGQVLTEG